MTTLRPLSGIAKRVHDDIMSLEPEAAVEYAKIVLLGGLQHDMETHREVIQHRIDRIVAKRATDLQVHIAKAVVSKSLTPEAHDRLLAAAAVISKAGFTDFTDAQRREYVRNQDRDPGGRFKTMHRKITYRTSEPMPGRLAERQGIPHIKGLTRHERALYQQAYTQVADMVSQFADVPVGAASLHLTYRTKDGEYEHVLKPVDPSQFGPVNGRAKDAKQYKPIPGEKFAGGGQLVDAQVIVDGNLNSQAAAFNLVGALAGTGAAGLASRSLSTGEDGLNTGAKGLRSFNEDWQRQIEGDINNPMNRVFRRVSRTSQLLSDIGGDNMPTNAKLALDVANAVGQYGPEAQKVIGPHADRATYRYRGVEKKPDEALVRNLAGLKRLADVNGKEGSSAREAMLYGFTRQHARRPGEAPKREFVPSPLIGHFESQLLPDPDLIELQRQSGVIPPSEGIIIDRNGQIVTQAVGYGDDWYLPFNLKTMSKLKGGDYIRTRTWGGLTTEDIYAGLVSGAKSVTVVSHNGTYTVEFDESFRGSRRYNDKAGRMVKRYGHLLDAVKSQQVTLSDIPPERLRELEAEAKRRFNPARSPADREHYKAKLEELKAYERENPTMAQAQVDALAEDFLTKKAGHLATAGGYAGDWSALAEQHVARQTAGVASMMRTFGADDETIDTETRKTRIEAANQVKDPRTAIATLGYGDEFAKVLEAAESEEKYRRSPLRLDGEGYAKAAEALKQQFPYYIANVRYTPKHRGRTDEGYVKPRFNRPEGALAGYFDPTISGASGMRIGGQVTGKVTADETRFQNRGVDVRAAKEARRVTPVPEQNRAAAPGQQQAAGASRVVGGEKTSQMDQLQAIERLFNEIKSQKNLQWEGQSRPIVGKYPDQLKAELPNTWGISEFGDLVAMHNDDLTKAGEAVLADAAKANSKFGMNIGRHLIEPVKNKGVEKGTPFSMLAAAVNPNRAFDFDDPEMQPGRHPDDYDDTIRRLSSDLRGREGNETLDAYIKRMIGLHSDAQKSNGLSDPEPFAQNVETAIKLKQAQRLKEKATADVERQAALERAADREALEVSVADVRSDKDLNDLLDPRKSLVNDKTIPGTLRETLRETKRDSG